MSLVGRLARSLPPLDASGRSSSGQLSSDQLSSEHGRPASRPKFEVRTLDVDVSPQGSCPALLGGAFRALRLPARGELEGDLHTLAPRVDRLESVVAVDCESTGLGTASGAIPFVLGVGWYPAPARFRIQQWVLRSVQGEHAMLADFARGFAAIVAGGRTSLLTFNGASFDVPLLRARLRHHGLPDQTWSGHHVDLVHVARRLFPVGRPDRRLATLEAQELGVVRRGDVAGADIPARFWQAMAMPGATLDPLEDVLVHNAGDVLVLPALLARLAASVRAPRDPWMALGAAKLMLASGRGEEALLRLEQVVAPWCAGAGKPSALASAGLQRFGAGEPQRKAALLAARLWRRRGAVERAALLWRWVCGAFPGDPEAHECLAKHLEHHLLRPAEALAVARASQHPCSRRLARLERKAAAGVPLASRAW